MMLMAPNGMPEGMQRRTVEAPEAALDAIAMVAFLFMTTAVMSAMPAPAAFAVVMMVTGRVPQGMQGETIGRAKAFAVMSTAMVLGVM